MNYKTREAIIYSEKEVGYPFNNISAFIAFQSYIIFFKNKNAGLLIKR